MNRHHAGALRRHVLKLLWVLQVLPGITELLVSDSKSEIDVDQTVADIGKALERTSMSLDSRSKLMKALTQCAAPSDAVHQLL